LACTYCSTSVEDAWIATDFVIAVPHPAPLVACHLVVAPRRHVAAFYDLDVQEQRMVWDAIGMLRRRISETLPRVQGFDVGFADGEHDDPDAHTCVHVVPRLAGTHVTLPAGPDWVDLDSQ
jgi:diadenosine tetraphosphate (Ap4A) HIT family hydrolase